MDKVNDNTMGFHFTIVDNYILNNANLSALEQIVYIHLKKHSALSNKCFPGINSLAKAISVSENTIRKILKSLKEKEYIDAQQRFNSSNEYTLLPYPSYIKDVQTCENEAGGAAGIGMVFESYQNNINPVFGSMEREKLINWFNAFEGRGDIVVKAIELAIEQGVRKIKYIESILVNWHQAGIKTLQQCETYQKEWEEKRRGSKNGNGSSNLKDSGTDKESRYDFSKFS
jgi:DnaD/phage-associated family protein